MTQSAQAKAVRELLYKLTLREDFQKDVAATRKALSELKHVDEIDDDSPIRLGSPAEAPNAIMMNWRESMISRSAERSY